MKAGRLPQAIERKAFAARLALAWDVRAAVFEEAEMPAPDQKWLLERVSRRLGKPVGQTTVSRWLSGALVPRDIPKLWALAMALEVDPGWLAFGDESKAPSPSGEATEEGAAGPLAPLPDHELTAGEVKRSGGRRRASGR